MVDLSGIEPLSENRCQRAIRSLPCCARAASCWCPG